MYLPIAWRYDNPKRTATEFAKFARILIKYLRVRDVVENNVEDFPHFQIQFNQPHIVC